MANELPITIRAHVQRFTAEIELIEGERATAQAAWLEKRNAFNGKIRQLYKEAKAAGLDPKVLKGHIRRRAEPVDTDFEAMVVQYGLFMDDVEPQLIANSAKPLSPGGAEGAGDEGLAAPDDGGAPIPASASTKAAGAKASKPKASPAATAKRKGRAAVAVPPGARMAGRKPAVTEGVAAP